MTFTIAGEAGIRIRISVAWWLAPYLNTLLFFCALTGTVPDFNKLDSVKLRALRIRVIG